MLSRVSPPMVSCFDLEPKLGMMVVDQLHKRRLVRPPLEDGVAAVPETQCWRKYVTQRQSTTKDVYTLQ